MALDMDRLLLIIEVKLHNVESGFKVIDNATKMAGRNVVRLHKLMSWSFKSMSIAALGFGLSMLFTGMAIKRFADSAIRALGNAFMQVADEQNEGVKNIMMLQAAFLFLKFTIFDTFANTELFANFVQFIVNIVNRVSEFVQQHPKLTQIMMVFLGIGVALGTVMMVIGQFTLLAVGLNISLFGLMAILLIITIAVTLLFLIWNSNMSTTMKLILTVIVVVGALVLILLLLGITISLPWILAISGILLLVGWFFILKNKTGSVGGAFKYMGLVILEALAHIADGIMYLVIAPLNLVIQAINAVIKASNNLLGTNFSTIGEIQYVDLSSKVKSMRESLIPTADETETTGDNTENTVEQKKTNDKLDTLISLFQGSNLIPSPEL